MFLARPITASSLRAAFAVLQLANPDANLPAFRRWAAAGRLHAPKGAPVGVFDRRDYVHALFKGQIAHSVSACCLNVTEFTHTDQMSMTLMVKMIDAVEAWAKSIGCDQMTIQAANTGGMASLPLSNVLVSLGFSGESVVMARRF